MYAMEFINSPVFFFFFFFLFVCLFVFFFLHSEMNIPKGYSNNNVNINGPMRLVTEFVVGYTVFFYKNKNKQTNKTKQTIKNKKPTTKKSNKHDILFRSRVTFMI